ncbi:MAG: response regulator [Dehalococcoidia bacterium]|nr:response regulator [Dehalococcoidia bacterium]
MSESKTIFALTADFNSSIQIAEAAKARGFRCVAVRSPAELPSKLAAGAPDLVVVDLQVGGFDPAAVVQEVHGGNARAPVIAFGRHTEPAALRAARQGGCTEVLVRSDFFPKIGEVLGKHLGLPA